MRFATSILLMGLSAALAAGLDVSLAQAAEAQAAKPSLLGKHDADAPINIAADKFVADENAKTGTWSGNVVITQGDMRMRANSVRMNVVGKDNKPDKIFAQGNVVVDSPSSGTVTGDNGVYDVVQRSINLTGHGPNGALRADQFQIDRSNKLLTLIGHVQMTIVGKKT